MPKSVKKSLKKSVKFNALPPKHQKRKRKSISQMDDEELDEYFENKEHAQNYKKQFKNNQNYAYNQHYALKDEMSPSTWDELDNSHGPTVKYVYPLELQTGPEIEANFNALVNREIEIPQDKRRILGLWGGRKSRKGRKNNKRKSRKWRKNTH